MLMTLIAAIVLIGLLFTGMAIGVILANKPVKGSCGGLSAVGLEGECEICGRNPSDCDNPDVRVQAERAAALAVDANRRD